MAGRGRQEIEEFVASLAGEFLAGRADGLGLDRVEFARGGGRAALRVFLDHPTGVTLDHCQEVAQALGEALDRTDSIAEPYSLEVSSPGVERPLLKEADFERFKGRLATLHLYRAIGGNKSLTGHLGGLSAEAEILLDVGPGGLVRIPWREVSKAHLTVDWSAVGNSTEGRQDRGGDSR